VIHLRLARTVNFLLKGVVIADTLEEAFLIGAEWITSSVGKAVQIMVPSAYD